MRTSARFARFSSHSPFSSCRMPGGSRGVAGRILIRIGPEGRPFLRLLHKLCFPTAAALDLRYEHRPEERMSKFVISPHFRLQEWVAEEKGYFAAEGLDYEF